MFSSQKHLAKRLSAVQFLICFLKKQQQQQQQKPKPMKKRKKKTNKKTKTKNKQWALHFFPFEGVFLAHLEKIYLRSQILERHSFGEYRNIFDVPVLPKLSHLHSLERVSVIQKITILEQKKNGLVLGRAKLL